MSAVVVTSTLDWKLHGFDLLSEHALPGDFALRATSWMVPAQYQAGEVARQEWDTIRQSPPWAVDAWGLGCMLQVEKGLDRGREERGRRQLQQLPC
jgi:SCY1-like protein 1